MTIFDLDADFTVNFNSYRHGTGYVAKGVILFRGKPKQIFEATGATISDAAAAAWAKAREIHRQLERAKSTEKKRSRRRLPQKA